MAQVQVPFSYVQQVQSPAQSILQGYQSGLQMQDRRRQLAMQEQAMLAQQQAQAQNEQFRQAFQEFATKPMKSVSDYTRLIAMAPKEMVSSVQSVYNAMSEEAEKVERRQAAELISAFKTDPARGKEILDTRIEAAKNAGNMEEVQALQAYRKIADVDPDAVVEAVALQAGMAFGDEFLKQIPGLAEKRVQSSEILADGTFVIIYTDGTTEVKNAEGVPLEGEARAKAIREAQKFKSEAAAITAGGTAQAKNLQERADKALGQMENIDRSIDLYNQALDALNKGAQTGLLASFFPSISAQTREFKRISDLLGLDIINAYTFGALSEAEMDLALRVGGLDDIQDPETLKEQIIARRDAQIKLKGELRRAAIELSRPGMTIEKWLSDPRNYVSKRDALDSGGDDRFAGFSIVEE
jgi:tetratricopeptide (TPR) repeat protein